jgi:hypothetical protein
MANFCQQCSLALFGEDFGDLSGLLTAAEAMQGFGMQVLCEGCGPAWVDHLGCCHAPHCLHQHGKDEVLGPELAQARHDDQQRQGRLCIWTVYERPADYPQHYVARLYTERGRTHMVLLDAALGSLRVQLPAGLTVRARQAGDDPVIIESWL